MEPTREQIVANIDSRFIVLDIDGSEHPVSDLSRIPPDRKGLDELRRLIAVEQTKGGPGDEPLSIKAMRDLELVDYEPASDKGHFRFYPKGALVFNLLHDWAEEIALGRLGALAIETPIIYDWDEPDIRSQAESFHERHYQVRIPNDPEKKFILRFAGDFGLFRMMKDARLTYRHLPVRMYEFAPSFRYERSGELAGLRRLRGFWMPDIHSFCLDLAQGIDEYDELFRRYTDLANGTGVHYAVAFRIVGDFYERHKERILDMIRYDGKPAYLELLSDMKHYWVMKHEINTIDCHGGICQVSTVQLDIKDASLYGIEYVDANNERKGCTIVHSSIGSPERWLYSILENALKDERPSLPLWLAPTQVRFIPINNADHLDVTVGLADEVGRHRIRVDIDDRSNSVGWKIRQAEREWVPYIILIGDRERDGGGALTVRERGGNRSDMYVSGLVKDIKRKTADMPFRPFPSRFLSKRPVFRGRD